MISDEKTSPPGSDYGSSRASMSEEGFADVNRHLRDAREQAGRYVTAQLDRVKATARSVVLFGLVSIAGIAIGVTVVITAAVLLCVGFAGAIGELLGGRQWAGDLIAGGAVLGLIGIGGFIAARRIASQARRQTIESYERWNTGESTK